MTGGIYIISKTKHAERWRNLRHAGYPIISRWLDQNGDKPAIDLFCECLTDISMADCAVVYQASGEILNDGKWEIAAAHHFGIPIFAFGIDLNGLFNSREFDDTEDMWMAVRKHLDLGRRWRSANGQSSSFGEF